MQIRKIFRIFAINDDINNRRNFLEGDKMNEINRVNLMQNLISTTANNQQQNNSSKSNAEDEQTRQVTRTMSDGSVVILTMQGNEIVSQTKIMRPAESESGEIKNNLPPQPLTFAEGTTQKVKSIMQSYDANSVFANPLLSKSNNAEVITTKKFMPDGSIVITTKKDGKVIEETKKKPHLIPVHDPLSQRVKMEPFHSVFELI